MKYKKGDLVKVIKLKDGDSCDGVELNKTYKVISVCDYCVEIDLGKGYRYMLYSQLKKVKNKSIKDLKIEELENQIQQMKYRYC